MSERCRVLLVDDETSFREPLSNRLRRQGFEVDEADSGEEALRQARARQGDYDVAVIDQVMGPPNGIEVMRRLRQLYPGIEVIILTGWGDMGPGEEALQAGAYRYLSKPVGNPDELALNIRMAARFGQERQRRLALQTLVSEGEHIGEAQSEDKLYERLYQGTRELLPDLDGFLISSYDKGTAMLRLRFGRFRGDVLELPDHKPSKGLLDYVLNKKQPLLLEYGDTDLRITHGVDSIHPELPPCVSEVIVPMFIEGQAWGTVDALTYHSGVRYTQEHLEVLQALANQVAVAIRNVQQLREAQELQQAVAALARQRGKEAVLSTIVAEAHRLIGHDYTSLVLQTKSGALRKVPYVMPPDYTDHFEEPRQEGGLTRLVIEEREPIVIGDASEDPRVKSSMRQAGIRSMLGMPMAHGGRVVGVLYTHTFELWSFNDHELNLWRTFASHAAAVLYNALDEEASEIWRLLDEQIATCNDRQEIMRLFAQQAMEALQADLAVLYPYDPTIVPGAPAHAGEAIRVGTFHTPWRTPRGGMGGGVYQAIREAPNGLLLVNDLSAAGLPHETGHSLHSRMSEREGIHAFVGLRLDVVPEGVGECQMVGHLLLDFRSATHFEPTDLIGLQMAGSRVAAAIQRLYMLDELQAQRRQLDERLQAIIEIMAARVRRGGPRILEQIIQVARDALGLDCCVVLEYDVVHERFIVDGAAGVQDIEIEHILSQAPREIVAGLDGMAVALDVEHSPWNGMPLVQREGLKTLIICPLWVEGEPLGLWIGGYRHQRPIRADEQEAAGMFADQAGLMIRDVRQGHALQQVQQRLERRQFLDWLTLIDNSWRHSLVGKAAAIRNHAAIMNKRLDRSGLSAAERRLAAETVREIDRLAHEIASAPPRIPQSWELDPEIVPLAPLLEEIAQRESRPSFASGALPVAIRARVAALGDAQVQGYRRWLIYALEALIQNASSAMPQGGQVMITGRRRDGWAEVRIRDTGEGVPSELREHLFRRPISKERDQAGMGIGGLLAATIIEDHGGSIELERPGPKDTTVLIRLPILRETVQ